MYRLLPLIGGTALLGLTVLAADPPADFKPYTQKLGDATFDMVPIPGGTFTMGSPETEKGRRRGRRSAMQGPGRPVLDG